MSGRTYSLCRLGVALLVLGLSLSLTGCVLPPSPAPSGGIQPRATEPAGSATATPAPAAATRPGAQLTPIADVQIQITGKTTDQTATPQHVMRVPVSDSPLQVSVRYPGPVEADIDAVRVVQPTTVRWRTELVAGGDANTVMFGLTGNQPGIVTLQISAAGYAPVRFSIALEATANATPGAAPGSPDTPAAAPATPIVGTAVPGSGSLATPGPAAPSGQALSSPQSITLADDGATINMKTGERFVLALGEDYDWTVTSEDPAVLGRLTNILTVRGAQGVYEAHQAGHTTLTAAGNPVCLKSQPPCGMPSRQFQVQVVVQ